MVDKYIPATRSSTPDPIADYLIEADPFFDDFDEDDMFRSDSNKHQVPDALPPENDDNELLQHPPSLPNPSQPVPDDLEGGDPIDDDIRTEFHTHSGRKAKTARFEDYGRSADDADKRYSARYSGPEFYPWSPFALRLDFELAELILEASLNKAQTEKFISLMHRCSLGVEKFTIANHKDLQETWGKSSTKSTAVSVLKATVVVH